MFEQQQNTGKSASLAEKYANTVCQLFEANDRAAHAEHDLQVERITRQDLIDEEVVRRVAEAEERIRKELEAQFADKVKELEERNKALDKRESDVDKKVETIAPNISEQVRQQMSAAKTRFEKIALNRLADMFDMFMQAFIALGDKDSSKGQELLQKYQLAAKEAHESLTDEIKDKLAKFEAKSKSKTEQIASLVRMIFTQKRERVVFSKEERDAIYDKVLASVEFTDEEKKLEGEEKAQFRKDYAEPLWEDFKLWAASAILDVPKDSNIYQALNYMLRNYTELTNYIDIPDMPLDNNDTERLIRDMVMGKKAYLFCRDLDACKRAAMMYSLFGACKVLDKNPERWLCYVLKHIDSTPEDKYYTLLPEFWEDEEQ